MDATQRARQRLAELEAAELRRRPPRISARSGVRYELDGHAVVGLCSNDYLGLAEDPRSAEGLHPRSAAHPRSITATDSDAPRLTGAGASRLICGDLPSHRALEARLAALVGSDDAVLFPSGFQLNVGVLPVLLEAGDHVDSDALNHASLIDGMRLAPARPRILAHGLAPTPGPVANPTVHWWVTESIFSMDGDRLDPAAAREHLARGASMYVDEAHALGLFEGGQGWLGHNRIQPTVMVGTLSKAFGCAGAFVAASAPLCDLIRNRARSFVFSTGTSPALVEQIDRALDRVTGPEGRARRERLWANAQHLGLALGLAQTPPSPIFPVLIGDNGRALRLAQALLERGWHVQAIRPPTVPTDTARLRLTVSAAHEPEQLDAFATDLLNLLEREGLPLRIERGTSTRAADKATGDEPRSDLTGSSESALRFEAAIDDPPAPARRPA